VRYKIANSGTLAFSDDFETDLSNWTTVDADGDGFNWTSHINTGSGNYSTHSGNGVAYSESYNGGTVLYPDNWLITPQVQLGGSVSFWAIGQDASYPAEHFAIYVSTTGNNPSNFTQISQEYIATGEYVNYSADLSEYSGMGYVAIRHFNVSDQFILNIDDFEIYDPNEWITVNNVNGNSLDITGLTSNKNYVFQVQAVCGTNDESGWSASATFTTPDGCAVPTDLTAEVTGNAAELSWTGVQEYYNLQYREVDPTVPATIILNIPTDVWGDGSGYQMLIDADATAYGTIIPETGGLTSSGDASAETYAEFEYKLPTDADGSCTTTNILVEGSISIEIPAGTYDWCITNPTPGDRVWIAASNGNVGGRQDDYVFEPGTTYEFTIYVSGTNDAVDVTITDNNEWTLVEGVTNPYRLANLSAETTYKYKVQGVNCDGNGGTTDWSASATFITGEELVCEKILVDADNPTWTEDFEGYDVTTTLPERWTGVLPTCWTVPVQYTGTIDTLPQVYQGFNTTEDGLYSLRMHFCYMLAMPELDETVDLGKVRLNLNVRQPYYKYKLQIGVITDMDNPETSFVPVAVVNNSGKDMTNFECGFASVSDLVGAGRHIAFKNIGNSSRDQYCTNYLDDVTLIYVNEENCLLSPDTTITFEGLTTLSGATGVEPRCWEVIPLDVELTSTTKPQLYRGYNSTEGGNYSLRMMNRCVYAMPEFADDYPIENIRMTLKLRQPNSLYRLQVGVVDEEGEFHVVQTLKGSTTMAEKRVSFANCPVNGRIAFRNTLVPGTGMRTDYLDYSYNYIDDIYFDYVAKGKVEASDESVMDTDLDDIAVYPNPTTGNLYIDAMGIQKVECYNQMGQLVRVYDNVVNSIDLNNLSEGVYTLRITVPQGMTMRKVVKR
jgi:hypothetical protein